MLQDITQQRDSLHVEILSLRSTTSTLVVERDTLQHDLEIQHRAHEDTSSRLQVAESRIVSLEAAHIEDEEQQFEAFRTYLASRRHAPLPQHPTSSSTPTSSTV